MEKLHMWICLINDIIEWHAKYTAKGNLINTCKVYTYLASSSKQPYLNEPTQLILAQFNSIPISYMTCLANLFVHWTTVAPSFCIRMLFSYVATWCYSHLFPACIKGAAVV